MNNKEINDIKNIDESKELKNLEIIVKDDGKVVLNKKTENIIAVLDTLYMCLGNASDNKILNLLAREIEDTVTSLTIGTLNHTDEEFKNKYNLQKNVGYNSRSLSKILDDKDKVAVYKEVENLITNLQCGILNAVAKNFEIFSSKDRESKSDYTIKIYKKDNLFQTLDLDSFCLASDDFGILYMPGENNDDSDTRCGMLHQILCNLIRYYSLFVIAEFSETTVDNISNLLKNGDGEVFSVFIDNINALFQSVKEHHKDEHIKALSSDLDEGNMLVDKEGLIEQFLESYKEELLKSLNNQDDENKNN